MTDVEYSASLNNEEVLKALRKIERRLEDLADEGEKAFNNIGGISGKAGVAIGAVSGVVTELTGRLIDLASEAARAYGAMLENGIELNRQAEALTISLTNIFGGSQEAATAFLSLVDEAAVRLQTDVQGLRELSKAILPDVGDVQGTLDLLEQAVILGKDAGQNADGIRIALENALSGDFVSLQDRLNIPRQSIQRIRELSEEVGTAAALTEVLGERVERAGLSAEAFAATFDARLVTVQSFGRELQQAFGEGTFETLKDRLGDALAVFEDNREDIQQAASALGDVNAAIADIVATGIVDFIASIDFERVEKLADSFFNLVEQGRLLADVLFDIGDSGDAIDGLTFIVDQLARALRTAAELGALVKATFESITLDDLAVALTTNNPVKLLEAINKTAEDGVFSQEKFRESMENSLSAFDRSNERIAKQAKRIRERNQAATDTGDVDLTLPAQDIEAAGAEIEAAQEEVNDKRAELEEDLQEQLLDIQRDGERQRIDDEIRNAQRREDIARRNADKLDDIAVRNNQRIEDAARDLNRAEEDIAKDQSLRRIEIDKNAAERRADIERDFRQELERIRENFLFNAQEAERANDAQRFLQLQRQNEREIEQARDKRDESLVESERTRQREVEDAREQAAQELEAAREKNRRVLEDLQIRLERELEAQRIANERQLEEQSIAEQRQAEQRAREEARKLEDFRRAEEQKRAALEESLAEQLAMIEEFNSKQIDSAKSTADRIAEIYKGVEEQAERGSSAPQGVYAGNPFGDLFRAEGGPVAGGQPYIVGEQGPELFVPNQAGQIVPNRVMYSPPQQGSLSQIFNSSRTNNPTFNVTEDMFSDPARLNQLRNFVLNILAEAS